MNQITAYENAWNVWNLCNKHSFQSLEISAKLSAVNFFSASARPWKIDREWHLKLHDWAQRLIASATNLAERIFYHALALMLIFKALNAWLNGDELNEYAFTFVAQIQYNF